MLERLASFFTPVRAFLDWTLATLKGWWEHPRYRWVTPALLLLLLLLWGLTFGAPYYYPVGSLIKVEEGQTLGEVALELKEAHAIRSVFLFKVAAKLLGADRSIVAGTYLLPERQSVFGLAWRMRTGDFELEPTRVTIPEGANAREVTQILAERLKEFNSITFLDLAQEREGYLFPDTYFFLPGEEPETVITAFANNFEHQVATVQDEIVAFGRPLEEVIIMASLLEEEAPYLEDKRIIAGILWERIDRGIPLQVDAVFPYIIGRNSFELTRKDLQYDSPYNTYLYKGLPVGPITNPGLDSILAAVTPTPSDYLFYLSDYDGNFHYSKNYDQHLIFKAQYLGS